MTKPVPSSWIPSPTDNTLVNQLTALSVPQAGALVRTLNNYVSDGSIDQLLYHVGLASTTGVLQVATAASGALGLPIDEGLRYLRYRTPSSCSGIIEAEDKIRGLSVDSFPSYLKDRFGYPTFDLLDMLADPIVFLDWWAAAEPDYASAANFMKSKTWVSYFSTIVQAKTSMDFGVYRRLSKPISLSVRQMYYPTIGGSAW